MQTCEPLIRVSHLKKYFPVDRQLFSAKRRFVHAVDDVSLEIYPGETLGLVGESGCGKSTLGRAMIRLCGITDGEVTFDGRNLSKLSEKSLIQLRRKMQIIFQDPYASLNPRMTVYEALAAPLKNFGYTSQEQEKRVVDIAKRVGINVEWLYRYPHEFSGGQRQRIVIARALILEPSFVVCDEAVSALDVSVRSQVLNLMSDLQQEMGLTYLFISHDLSVIKHISDRIAVMYLGKIVELANKHELIEHPEHPYTKALISAIPKPTVERREKRIILSGDMPSPIAPPSGCAFHPRCSMCRDICTKQAPQLRTTKDGHQTACHFLNGFQASENA